MEKTVESLAERYGPNLKYDQRNPITDCQVAFLSNPSIKDLNDNGNKRIEIENIDGAVKPPLISIVDTYRGRDKGRGILSYAIMRVYDYKVISKDFYPKEEYGHVFYFTFKDKSRVKVSFKCEPDNKK